jgi:hypothetical protein
MQITVQNLIKALKAKGYPVFENGDYNINTVGIRSFIRRAGNFDDNITVFYKVAGVWKLFVYKSTTDPGATYLQRPLNVAGCAIMAEGFYRGAYSLLTHKGKPALKQVGTIKVYRDSNKDMILDFNKADLRDAGAECAINIHYSSGVAINDIGAWSAGCQVIAYGWETKEYREFLNHYLKAIAIGHANRFSYALISELTYRNANASTN